MFFYQLFGLSFWRHPFTANYVMFNFSKSVLMKKQMTKIYSYKGKINIFAQTIILKEERKKCKVQLN